ncbi:hypothetical protein [uncultured Pontibacter sp.]|nr:hypothetical protein [uncultured Pontibacter sp.]
MRRSLLTITSPDSPLLAQVPARQKLPDSLQVQTANTPTGLPLS